MLTVAARTFVGSVKTVNQDAYCVLVGQAGPKEVGLLAVCDGVGGLSSGELASSVAVRELSRWFEGDVARGLAEGASAGGLALPDVRRLWTSFLEDLNGRIWGYSQSLNVRMGTTFTGMVLAGGGFVVGHVGDCRAYRLGPEGAELLTRDQTLVQRELDAGRISAKQARRHPQASVILQALGAQEAIAPAFSFGEAASGDTLLICSDGLHRRLDEGDFALLSEAEGTEEALLDALDTLIARVVDRGEKDNITAVCARIGGLCVDGDDEPTLAAPLRGSE